ncbi:methyltransferase [Actinorhabdospora filicis]|uniref:Methyltransferase n=1 Tax=Actinorhabdospora filicis TaxID=1785913 RepID=A0A9W6WBK2_9ACTN|nr:class I SAM-dependent methyltransferase [Actinorhabdospora filicis]GLZ80704.1 methyltransferase [Actinorhabdospora filicis]
MPSLVPDDELHTTSVVANNAMNRQRGLASYARELGLDLPAMLDAPGFRWLDLCCGSAKALIEAGRAHPAATIVGVDLVDHFGPDAPGNVRLLTAALPALPELGGPFDLVTCVHGLHYVGDKLAAIAAATALLTPGGLFAANMDVPGLRGVLRPTAAFRAAGYEYDPRRRRLRRTGPGAPPAWRYLGADPAAGPNYTGQAAVDSWYAR